MKPFPLVAALVLLGFAPPAFAQGSSSQRAACTPDVWRLCASNIPNVGAITACLRRERGSLSAACRTVMDAGEAPPAVAAAAVAPPRVAARVASRRALAPPRYAARVAVAPRASMRRGGRYAARRPVARYAAVQRPRGSRGGFGMGGFGGNRASMREAAYWMRQLGGMSGMIGAFGGMGGMGGGGGMGGMSLDSIRDVRIGDILSMME